MGAEELAQWVRVSQQARGPEFRSSTPSEKKEKAGVAMPVCHSDNWGGGGVEKNPEVY